MLDAPSTSSAIICGPLTFDPATRELTGDHGRTVLQRKPAALLLRLLERPETLVSDSDLLTALYPNPDDEPDASEILMRGGIMHLRLHLRSACGDGVRVRNQRGVGYALKLR